MKKIVVFGASSSKKSINKQFSIYASTQFNNIEIIILDLNDFEMPIFSEDKELNFGIPEKATKFYEILNCSDAIIISFAEHNGSYTAAFKNIFDWTSRIGKIVWWDKPMLLLSTSDGEKGALSVLETAHSRISFNHKYDVPMFSLPNFSSNFNSTKGILNNDLNESFLNACKKFQSNLNLL
ncbi:NAD(P)H-dependent oxidoreductase [Flavobacteriaceae bacterium]|nr:NAD(P)H-dependent oxidoreductase [Flavobacteriaceae bacterium]